jgi:cysteinyl-tRNA synthetase
MAVLFIVLTVIRFHNTLSGKKETFSPLEPGGVKLYTCGPTVYTYAHVGNFRAYTFEDLLKRFLVFMGYKVIHVMNITDIDDKTIRGANAEGVSLDEYTKKYIEAFFQDIDTMRIARANHYPRATRHIPEMIAIVKGLVDKGYAYEKDGSYYFSIARFPDYGRLSKINLEDLQPGQRVDADEYEKESVHDFALWKAKKEGEPFWETEIGPGRPGWHIECSAMSAKYLGESFDIHCGGVDNIFPHHENEIAQSEAFFGKKFVNYWVHCHHLIRDGEKMAKSKGNTITISEILQKKNNPAALRYLLLSTHYRKQLNFTFEALDHAEAALQRINEFAGEVTYGRFPAGKTQEVGRILKEAEKKFVSGLSDDLNISTAVTALFNLIKQVNILMASGKVKQEDAAKLRSFLNSINTVLAVIEPREKIRVAEETKVSDEAQVEVQPTAQAPAQIQDLPPEIRKKIIDRENARVDKNYQLADHIRRELLEKGFIIEDTKDGPRVVRVKSTQS